MAQSIRTEQLRIQIPGEAGPMGAYLAAPEAAGPHPAVMVIEEIFGVNAHIRDVTERVAREGYVAIAPEIYHREAPGLDSKYDDEGRKKGMALIPKLSEKNVLADLAATLAALRARKDVRGDRIGCMGFCIGGHIAYLAACATDVRATASFYGGGIARFGLGGAPPTVMRTEGIKGRIVCLFGHDDPSIPADQVETIRQALERHKIRHEIVVYENTGHAFFCDQRAGYDEKAARDAWQRVKTLWAEELRA